MPCYTPPDHEQEERDARERFRHNSDVAEMLCTVMSGISPADIATMPLGIQEWWREHQLRDGK